MKKLCTVLILLSYFLTVEAQVPRQNRVSPFQEIKSFHWNTPNGLPYVKSFSGNYSIDVYRKLDKTHTVFLSRSKQALLIYNMQNGRREKTISLPFFPVDFAVSRDMFYVAGSRYLYLLDKNGKIINKWFFGNKIRFVANVKVIDNQVYLITPDQKTWSFNTSVSHWVSQDGIILRKGLNGKVIKQGKNRFEIFLNSRGGISYTKTVEVKKPLGTVRILGLSGTFLFVGVQTVLKEVPLKVERTIRVYQITKSGLNQVSSIIMPDMYYTYIKHDIDVSDSGLNIYISTPEKALFYRIRNLEKIKSHPQIYLPYQLYKKSYLYNNHLLPAMEGNPVQMKSVKNTPITRQKIIQNAEPYATHKWFCHTDNIWDRDCSGVHVKTPAWVRVGNNISIPYKWGGFSSLSEFDEGIKNGVSAGDCDTHGYGASPSCAVGVDCSGFVSRAWGLGTKYSTRTIPDISTEYPSYDDLKPGDVVDYPGHHVRLVHTVYDNGSFLIIEAAGTATDWRVGYNDYTVADFQGRYLPRRYNYIAEVQQDTTAPTTSVLTLPWETGSFTVHFKDDDNVAVQDRFYQVEYFDGSHWYGNVADGFFNDNFTGSLSTQWHKETGNWAILHDTLNQSDESDANTNIYSMVKQNAAKYSFMYEWRMKIGGSGDDRRAGLVFMSDDPTLSQRNDAYMVYFRADQNTCQIYKSVNNSIHLETNDACVVNAGKWFNVKVIYNAVTGKIDVYKNNKLVSVWIDAFPLTYGNSISLRTGNANVLYDNIKVLRSRADSAVVTTGKNGDVPYQNFSPSHPACLILSFVADSSHNLSVTDSAFVNIDWTKPEDFKVNDGLGSDIDSTHETTQISANWTNSSDVNSGIKAYYCCVGTSPKADNVVSWFDNGRKTRFTKTHLSLTVGDTCYVSVTAMDGAGLTSDTIVSDGVAILRPLGIRENRVGNFLVYPNPAKEVLWIKTGRQKISGRPEIFNLAGKQIPVTITKTSSHLWEIGLHNVAGGFYFIRIKTNNGYFSKKILVVK